LAVAELLFGRCLHNLSQFPLDIAIERTDACSSNIALATSLAHECIGSLPEYSYC